MSLNQKMIPLPEYKIGDLVWSPWSSVLWPAMVTYDPHQAVYYRSNNNKITQYHIQYFGIVAQRGWVPVKNLQRLRSPNKNGSAKPQRKKLWKDFEVAIEEVTEAYSLNLKQRKLTFIFNYSGTSQKAGKVSIAKKKPFPQQETTPALLSPKVATVTISPPPSNGGIINVSPRALTKYSLREKIKLSRRKINAIETNSPLHEIGNIDPILSVDSNSTNTQLLTTGMSDDAQLLTTGTSNDTQLLTTGTSDDTQLLETDTTDDAKLLATGTSNNTQLLATGTSDDTQLLANGTSDDAQLLTTGTSNDTQLSAIDTSNHTQLLATGTSDDTQLSATGSNSSNNDIIVPVDIFPLAPPASTCTQNLLTPPSTGSEADSTDTSNDILKEVKHSAKSTSKSSSYAVPLPPSSLSSSSCISYSQQNICSICDNPDQLITCSGHCFRSYHIDCLGLISLPHSTFTCDDCLLTPSVCFVCKNPPKDGKELVSCSVPHCTKNYHLSCVKSLKTFKFDSNERLTSCGLHSCAKCVYTDTFSRPGMKLVQCSWCPFALHKTSCLVAGCELSDDKSMICYQHLFLSTSLPQSVRHFNMNSCLHCGEVGSLICCDLCSAAYHVQCLPEEHRTDCQQQERWLCPPCVNHDLPTYGSVVMVKCGAYRWWPAEILSPSNVPQALLASKLTRCMFLVRFFASNQYFWTHHGRVILFTEECAVISGDKSRSVTSKQPALYSQAFQEALAVYRERKLKLEESKPVQKESRSFIHIKRNRYLIPRPVVETEMEPCRCTPDSPCGPASNCINRAVYIECSPKNCPTGDQCLNQRIQRNQVAQTETFYTGSRGWGLKAKHDIVTGDFVVEYIGEVLNMSMVQERLKMAQEKSISSFYFLTLERNLVIDASEKSNHARFINHSCDPNCETQKWTVNGETRIGIIAIKDILAGTELTFDYRLDSLGNEKKRCLCGSSNCSGYLGERPKQTQQHEKTSVENVKGEKKHKRKRLSSLPRKEPALKQQRGNLSTRATTLESDKQDSIAKRKRASSRREEGGDIKPKAVKRKETKKVADSYDDECFCCGDGGDLLLCDYEACFKVYHLSCIDLDSLPDEDFICPCHSCRQCKATEEDGCLLSRCSTCPNTYCESHREDKLTVTGGGSATHCLEKCSKHLV